MDEQRSSRGQSMLEVAIILPVLIILMVGLAEMGFGLRNYLVVVNADREACRFAAKGVRYTDEEVGARVVSAGGIVRHKGQDMPFLRTYGMDPNTAVIVTRIPLDSDGDVLSVTVWYTGVLPTADGGVRSIAEPTGSNPLSPDSQFTMAQIDAHHKSTTQEVNAMRQAAGLAEMEDTIVVVEVYFMHHPLLLSSLVPMPDPWMMYGKTEMREAVVASQSK